MSEAAKAEEGCDSRRCGQRARHPATTLGLRNGANRTDFVFGASSSAMPAVARLARYTREAFDELERAASRRTPRGTRKSVTLPMPHARREVAPDGVRRSLPSPVPRANPPPPAISRERKRRLTAAGQAEILRGIALTFPLSPESIVAVQPTFMLIADIAGYTRFMKFHRASLAHAHEIVAQLLEAVIDCASPRLTLAKLEGDAAFFYVTYADNAEADLAFVAEQAAAIYRTFHARIADLKINNLCTCDGCVQAGDLKIKVVGHFGEAAIHKVKHLTELAGVDVILVHRMLKNDVPIPEYMLMTAPVHERVDAPMRARSASHDMELGDLGRTPGYYFDLERYVGEIPAAERLSMGARVARHMKLSMRSLPQLLGIRKACAGFRNVPDAPSGAAS